MASIEERGGAWSVYWRNGGRGGKKERCTFDDETSALKAKRIAEAHGHLITREQVNEAVLGVPAAVKKSQLPTVEEWSATWLASKTRISPGQRARYRRQLDTRILPEIGHLHLDEVAGSDISDLLNKLSVELEPTTVTRYYACVHAMFRYAATEKKIDDNPAKRTDFVRDMIADDDTAAQGEAHVYLTHEEYALIRANLAEVAVPLVEYLAGTGARFGEATAAHVESIAPSRKEARIHAAWKRDEGGKWYRGATKGRQKRALSITTRLLSTLEPCLKRGRKELLLCAPEGGRWDNSNFADRYWAPAVAAAMRCTEHPPPTPEKPKRGPTRAWRPDEVSTCDCPGRLKQAPTPHDLRHTHAAWLIRDGHHMKVISERLGHGSTSITDRTYAGVLPELHVAVADSLDKAMLPVD